MSETPRPEAVLRFEPFELDLERAELRKNGRKVKLGPQPFQVLALLAARGDRVVTREELCDELWGGETFVDFEHGINSCIKRIRQALGDDPENPRYIATVPRRGYRFVARTETANAAVHGKPSRGRAAALAISFLIGSALAWTLYQRSLEDLNESVLRTNITTDKFVGELTFSPDGSTLVYLVADYPSESGSLTTQLMLRRLDEADARALPGTDGSFNPFFFPDGESVGYALGTRLARVRVDGSEARTLAEHGELIRGITASEDEIVFGSVRDGLYRLSLAGGKPEPLTRLAVGERSHRWPHFLTDGRTVLFTILLENGSPQDSVVAASSLADGQVTRLVEKAFQPTYASTGHLLFGRGEGLMAVPFDASTVRLLGEPVEVVHRVAALWPATMNQQFFAISRDGKLAYVSGDAPSLRVVWLDRKGDVVETLIEDLDIDGLALSPDGERAALSLNGTDIAILDLTRGGITKLPLDLQNAHPVWSPDGKTIACMTIGSKSSSSTIRSIALGTNASPRVWHHSRQIAFPHDFSPDGRLLAFSVNLGGGIHIMDLVTGSVEAFVEGRADQPAFSPNGSALAYTVSSSEGHAVFVQGYPDTSWKRKVSTEGGVQPAWSRDGAKLFYKFRGGLYEVDVVWTPEPSFGSPTLLFERERWGVGVFDVGDDGRFLAALPDEASIPKQIRLVTNWFHELEEKVPVK